MHSYELDQTDLRHLLGGNSDTCDDNTCIDEPPPITLGWGFMPPPDLSARRR